MSLKVEITLLISFLVLFLLFAAFMGVANAGARTYGADKLAKDKQLVTCRLAKKKIIKDQKICLFRGPNNTTDTVFIDRFELCPRTIKCIYEPNKSNILEDIIPKGIKIMFYKALRESFASEHGARMTAMHKATDNAAELADQLKLTYNKARQASITNEILEIVGGAEALKK